MSLTRHEKRVLIAASIIVGLALSSVVAVAVLIHQSGTIVINVKETGPSGDDVSIRIPGIFALVALRFMPDELFREVARSSDSCLPLMEAIAGGLRDLPDCDLVDVASRSERVTVSKKIGHLVVAVDSRDEEAYISLPLSIVSSFAGRIERAGRKQGLVSRRGPRREPS